MSTALRHPDRDLIYSQFNCVLRHHVCPDGKNYHASGTGGDEVWKKCAEQLIEFEGKEAVSGWLDEVAERTSFGRGARQRFHALFSQVQ